jgi:SAM-dependent methyltransferase
VGYLAGGRHAESGYWRGVFDADADAAALFDLLSQWDPEIRPSDAFYDELVMAAASVLDVGCGTGSMLHPARDRGHAVRLVGLDPDGGSSADLA